MIFVTVGAQMPFDRLIRTVDSWAERNPNVYVYAQIGDTDYEPRHLRFDHFVTPEEMRLHVRSADCVVAHAGMGTIITAMQSGTPALVMPRRGDLRETRNDHQVATAERFQHLESIRVAWDESELLEKLDTCLMDVKGGRRIAPYASGELSDTVAAFLDNPNAVQPVDGIVCFGGEDYWYHNRGHFDMQMMRELSQRLPVLYVNSIGMRTPTLTEGRVFLKRVARKLRSWSNGLQQVREDFWVLSPVSIPKFHQTSWAKAYLADQVRDAARRMGSYNPLVWVACPPAAEVIDRIPAAAVVYQRTDRFEHFPGVDSERIRGYDQELKRSANLTLFCSTSVYEDEKSECKAAGFVDHGVDYETFVDAGDARAVPEDVRSIPGPKIGFVGGIDIHTFDPPLFLEVAKSMPDCSFVLVGGCSLPPDWCTLENVHLLGRKPYDAVADYMAACDVLIMPWNNGPWIKACNPVKLKEYLATGRPVVSTPFDELARYEGFVSVAEDASSFAKAIRDALEAPPEAAKLRARVAQETWTAKADTALARLREEGVGFQFDSEVVEELVEAPVGSEAVGAEGEQRRAKKPRLRRGYWKKPTLAAAGILACISVFLTYDAWSDILRLAMRDEESSHIFLVLPVAVWLIWVRKESAERARRTGAWFGPALVALGWLFYSVGDTYLFQSMWHFGAILIAVGCIVTMLGSDMLLRLWPAFVVLVFLIPVPAIVRAQIAPPMQTVAAHMTATVLQYLGQDVTLSGKVLMASGVPVGIAEACNGIRMVFAFGLVCFLYAFSAELSTVGRLLVLAVSPLIAVLANVTRLVPTVWLYGRGNAETAEWCHDFAGWAMMPLALFLLMGAHTVLAWAFREDQTPVESSTGTGRETPVGSGT